MSWLELQWILPIGDREGAKEGHVCFGVQLHWCLAGNWWSACTWYKYIPQSPKHVKVLSKSGIKHDGHIKSIYRSYYDYNWVLMSVFGTWKDLKTLKLDHKKSWERSYVDQAPVPLSIFRSNSKFDENSERSSFEYTGPITTIFCTRHDSNTVVTCAKYRCDRLRIFYTRVFLIFIEFRIRSKYA